MRKCRVSEKVCVVICNWNKVDDLLSCIESVFNSSYKNFDLVVVENGSDPEIADKIRAELPSSVVLLENIKNTGGSGGFNRGMEYAIDKKIYQSVWLLDNDVVVDSDCLFEQLQELRKSDRNAMVGPVILQFEFPDLLQELGAYIDWNRYDLVSHLKNLPLNVLDQQVISVDYLAACSILVDLNKLKEVGLMDGGYFLYFDDAEWCKRFQKGNYLVKATPKAKVWHKSSASFKKNHMSTYYRWRNGFHFFMHSIGSENEIKEFIHKYMLGELFTALYSAFKLGKTNAFQTGLCAIIDALSGKRGKAENHRILPLDHQIFGRFFSSGHKKILVISESIEHHKILTNYIAQQKFLEKPVMYYTKLQEEEVPNSMREWAQVKPLHELNQIKVDQDQDVFVLCRHILSFPSLLEKTYQPLLEKQESRVFFLDTYSNVYQGYQAMMKERKLYNQLQKELDAALGPFFEKKIREIIHF